MPKIVCAEDDKLIATSLVEGFTAAGFEVTAAEDGEAAVAKIKEVKPDVVLLDIMMPKLDGYGVVWELKSDPETAKIPVIMLTNLSDSDTLSKILEAGVTDYLLKSEQTIDQIIAKVNEVLARAPMAQA
ncbi:MAG TPA: response regulator [Patescibacteria group bacterium]|jgi:DNA-binding response OmpR family regulator|nr:response regulator [Patescibacteria group bacterium]